MIRKIIVALVTLGALCVIPAIASAATFSNPSIPFWATNGIVSCTGNPLIFTNGASSSNPNACTSYIDLVNTFTNVIYLAMTVAIFIIAPILFVVGGIMILAAGANPEMLSKGKHTLINTAIGLVIVLVAFVVVHTVIATFNVTGIGGGF